MSRKTLSNSVLTLKRLKMNTVDAIGGIVQTKITTFKLPCRIRQLNASERMVGGKDGVVSTHRIYCTTADIRAKDEVIIDRKVYDVNIINQLNLKDKIEVDVTLRN